MNRRVLLRLALAAVLLSVVALGGWSAASGQEDDTTALGAIEGLVFQDDDGDGEAGPEEYGIDGIVVRLTGDDVDEDTLTDDSGQFRFEDLEPGEYEVVVEPGMVWSVIGRSLIGGLEIDGEELTGLEFALQPVEPPEAELEELEDVEEPTEVPDMDDAVTGVVGLISEPEDEDASADAEADVEDDEDADLEDEDASADTEDEADLEEDDADADLEDEEAAADIEDEADLEEDDAAADVEDDEDVDLAEEEAVLEDEAEVEAVVEPELYTEPAVDDMPDTGVADLGKGSLLTLAMLGLALLGGIGLALERRKDS
jgi:hypothetical protein